MSCSLSLTGVSPLYMVSMLSAAVLTLCPGCRKPPDLTACTHLEVQYEGGALGYFFPGKAMQEGVLSEQEREYVRSYDKWTVTDQERIKDFADHISQGAYRGKVYGKIDTWATITGYQGSERTVSFAVHNMSITTDSKHHFAYPPRFLSLRSFDPAGLNSLRVRWECGVNLSALIYEGLWPGRGPRPRLAPNRWCDTVLQHYRSQYITRHELDGKTRRMYPDAGIARRFSCPSASPSTDANDAHSPPPEANSSNQTSDAWTCDFAMNPHCEPNSAPDTVLLFETKAGWNQHGGPELFTFDNHNPKGGLVLLNDGTVKFIRTEEELKQLRWK